MKKFLGLLFLLVATQALGAETPKLLHRLGNLLSPGQLSSAHQYLETTTGCLKCHSPTKGVQDLLCLDCHREIQDKLDQSKGFHGLNKEKSCLACHTEHKGRKSKIFDLEQVKHNKLKLKLTGAHQLLKCEKCHQPKFQTPELTPSKIDGKIKRSVGFFGLEPSCESCHTKAHGEQFEKKLCTDCHVDRSWKLTKFNHETQSDFKLRGKHTELTCKACHFKSKKHPQYAPFQGLEQQCSACHFDPHQGRSGKECNSCHFPDRWDRLLAREKIRGFNHNKTRFKLRGQHKKVACAKCHQDRSQKDFRHRGFKQCTDCHKDPHRGQFVKKTCESCHRMRNRFKQGFDHNKTDFPLKALHQDKKCVACHQKGQFVLDEKKTCEGCHIEIRSVMQGRWLSGGVVIGPDPMFRTVDCGSCHKQSAKKVTSKAVRKACVKCHNEYFGDLWDYREKKYGPHQKKRNEMGKKKHLRQTHRFGDFVPEEP